MKKRKLTATIFFISVFIGFCILRFWFIIPLVFVFALTVSIIKGNRGYCYSYCPMGFAQDIISVKPGEEEEQKNSRPEGRNNQQTGLNRFLKKYLWLFVSLIFWSYLIIYIVLLYQTPALLWTKIFTLVLYSLASALLLQNFISKRYWCVYLCPMGMLMNQIIKFKKRK